ncbi:cupredoxin domain-containing protein [Caldimonas tepidiphila]|uniref:cupredoxin domain-containing protein n=1 Tax=Caldimonas tepidiphila TaxID=2315841 RepID=UPI000E5BE96C|nr:cupredoxin family protein [Caldimonas tepidiphila]
MRIDLSLLRPALAAGLCTALLAALPAAALAHGAAGHAPKAATAAPSTESYPWGREGRAADVTRTIEVDMKDALRFVPGELRFRRGETVRLVVHNSGRVMHELVLGTEAELKRHAELMKQHPGMEHDEPYMAHVAPGERAEIVWTFDKPGRFMYGCLLPGHFEGGMVGRIVVR